MSVDVWERLRSEPGMRSLTKGLIAGIAMLAWAEPTAADKSVIAGIGGGQGVDQATLSVRADGIEDEWTATVGAATARQWRAYLDQLPPAIADAFMAWWQARGWAEWQHRAWQNRSANANDARSRTDRLAAIERRINADRAGGRRAFDAEVVRCYSDGGVDRLVYCGPSILDLDPTLARPSAEPQDPLQLISRLWQHRWNSRRCSAIGGSDDRHLATKQVERLRFWRRSTRAGTSMCDRPWCCSIGPPDHRSGM